MKATKCLTDKCNRVGEFKNGYCFWCNRRTQFFNGKSLGYNSKEYVSMQESTKVKCQYPNCNEYMSNYTSSNLCVKHRALSRNADIRTN